MILRVLSLVLSLLLAGCSGMRLIESDVRSTSTPQARSIEAGARYRFERLPSQGDSPQTEIIETIAREELARVGLVHDDVTPRYSAQLTSSAQSYLVDSWGRPHDGGGRFSGSIMIGSGSFGVGSMVGMGMAFPPPSRYRHDVTLLLRELGSGQLVYETRAVHEGPWNDQDNILRALLSAALQDFPNPPAGPRRVKVEIPR